MGKYVNSKGKIRVLALKRGTVTFFVVRKGRGIYIRFSLYAAIEAAQRGFAYTNLRHNYELVNRTVKNNPILKLRDSQPDGLLILQKPKQLTLGI